jgi:hypothetical protein
MLVKLRQRKRKMKATRMDARTEERMPSQMPDAY